MSAEEFYIRKTKVSLTHGDITDMDTDAIVNAGNSLLMGGGVDGAIHRRGGSNFNCDVVFGCVSKFFALVFNPEA